MGTHRTSKTVDIRTGLDTEQGQGEWGLQIKKESDGPERKWGTEWLVR